MKQNIKLIGRVVRGVIGISVIALGLKYKTWWGVIGAFMLFEALMGWCVIHQICGSSECGKSKE